MRRPRVIPTLLYNYRGLVKSKKFKGHVYLGDYLNAIKIFNEKEVDEIIFLDIEKGIKNKKPDLKLIKEIASECFMPLCYGGGISTVDEVREILRLGVEKVAINSNAYRKPELIKSIVQSFGSQSVVISIDVKKNKNSRYSVYIDNGQTDTGIDPISYAVNMERLGAGELLLNSIDRDGTYDGYDTWLIEQVSKAVSIPVIACGGGNGVKDFLNAIRNGASAVAAGSLFVFYGRLKAVLINFPTNEELFLIFNKQETYTRDYFNLKIFHITTWYPHKKQEIEAGFIKEHIDSLRNYCYNYVFNLDFIESERTLLKFEFFKESNYEYIYICKTRIKNTLIKELISSAWFFYVFLKHKGNKFDVVNIHIAYPVATFLSFFKRIIRIPVVINEHWSAYHFNFYVDKNKRGLRKVKKIFFMCEKIFVVSKSLALDIVNFSGNKRLEYSIIPNIVDNKIYSIKRDFLPSSPTFLMVSIWSNIKKPIIIIEVFKKIVSAFPDAILRIGGYGIQIEDMKKKIKELDLEENVFLLGKLNRIEVADELNKSTALIHSSSYETFSVICAEAISCGVPVIASNVGGIPSFINNQNGILVDNESIEEWYDAITKMIKDRAIFNDVDISQKAHLQFSPDNVGEKYFEELKKLIQK